jgi:hypothetical protein
MTTDGNNEAEALRLVLAAFYAGGFSAVLRKADVWFPFTPMRHSERGRWVGWKDALRWALAAIFLILFPAFYFICVIVVFTKQAGIFSIHFTPPSLSDVIKFVVTMSLIAPQLGFYDVWQAIVRSHPDLFYSNEAKSKIQEHYPNAFKAGHGATVAWGFAWIFIPTLAFIYVIWKAKT